MVIKEPLEIAVGDLPFKISLTKIAGDDHRIIPDNHIAIEVKTRKSKEGEEIPVRICKVKINKKGINLLVPIKWRLNKTSIKRSFGEGTHLIIKPLL